MPTTSVTGVIDGDFAPYRDFYTRRVQRLERFKKARSFCCVVGDDELAIASLPPPPPPPITPPPASSSTGLDAKFTELRQKMISLMENDVTLMRQLLALGETIEGLKAESSRSRRSSLVSLSDEDDAIDVETDHEMVSGTVTQLLVNEDPSPFPPRKQYFSRKNSVLRIPIPPCHKHHNPRALRSPAGNSYNSTDDDVSSGVSSASSRRSEDSGSRQQHETRDKLSPLFSPNSSFCSARKITPSQRKGHDSNVSIDSGIRLSSPPHSPSHSDLDDNGVKEQEEEVFV